MKEWRIVAILLLALFIPFLYLPIPINTRFQEWWRRHRLPRALLTFIITTSIIAEVINVHKTQYFNKQNNDILKTESTLFQRDTHSQPTSIHRWFVSAKIFWKSKAALERIKEATFKAQIDNTQHDIPHLILVIGESYNKHHSSLYGYHLPTSPRMQKRKEEGALFLFTDVVTPWNITSNYFLQMFTVNRRGDEKKVGSDPIFPILFRRAGYEVSFFSNQYVLGDLSVGTTNQAGNFFLSDKTLSDSLFNFRNTHSYPYDMDLVHAFVDHIRTFHKHHTLDIVHLVGQHFDYSRRCPKSEIVFTEKDYNDRNIPTDARMIVMHYDNATHYNDKVFDSLLCLLKDMDVVVVFVADHGEEMYDGIDTYGRLFSTPDIVQARNEFEVPMWIWCSDSCRAKRPNLIEHIEESCTRPFSSENIPQILLSLASISSEWTDPQKNVISTDYSCSPRIIAGQVDYDSLCRMSKKQ